MCVVARLGDLRRHHRHRCAAHTPRSSRDDCAKLTAAGYLRRRQVIGGAGHLWLYGAGRNATAFDPAYRDAWRPSDAQLAHTLSIAETLAALIRPASSARSSSPAGEAKPNSAPGTSPASPSQTSTSAGRAATAEGGWHVEVDRGTESRNAWRRKLLRYLHAPNRQVLVVTTSDERARNIATVARSLGVPALTTDIAALRSDAVLLVYDVVKGCRRSVDELRELTLGSRRSPQIPKSGLRAAHRHALLNYGCKQPARRPDRDLPRAGPAWCRERGRGAPR
jgi:hypothetical protein